MRPFPRDQQLKLHCAAALVTTALLGEPHQFPPYTDSAVAGSGSEHTELAHVLVELLNADASNDPFPQNGHGYLTSPREMSDLLRGCPSDALGPHAGWGVIVVGIIIA